MDFRRTGSDSEQVTKIFQPFGPAGRWIGHLLCNCGPERLVYFSLDGAGNQAVLVSDEREEVRLAFPPASRQRGLPFRDREEQLGRTEGLGEDRFDLRGKAVGGFP